MSVGTSCVVFAGEKLEEFGNIYVEEDAELRIFLFHF